LKKNHFSCSVSAIGFVLVYKEAMRKGSFLYGKSK